MRVWYESSVDTIEKVIERYSKNNKKIKLLKLSPASSKLIENIKNA